MKSLIKIIILTSLFTSLTSAIYEAGRACGNNIQCTHNCYNSQYNIASQDGVCNFVCDVSATNSTRFSPQRAKSAAAPSTQLPSSPTTERRRLLRARVWGELFARTRALIPRASLARRRFVVSGARRVRMWEHGLGRFPF
jgi:hypothetical protein